MKLFFYYAAHTIKNQIKKLFKSWVIIFVAVFFVIGIIGGIIGAVVGEALDNNDETPEDEPVYEEIVVSEETKNEIILLAVGGISLLVLLTNAAVSEKHGGRMFLMPDANMLFTSPMKPQAVLIFKTMTQMGVTILTSLFIFFQIPNFIFNLGLDGWQAFSLILAWFFITFFSNMISILFYILSGKYERFSKARYPSILGLVSAVALSFILYFTTAFGSDKSKIFEALNGFFNAPVADYIPVWGWIKGFVAGALYGNPVSQLVFAGLLLVLFVALMFVTWKIDADFYESALFAAADNAERLEAAKTGRKIQRKKERSEKIKRDGFRNGFGANIFFYKTLYNHIRFSFFGFLSKTGLLYLALAFSGAIFQVRTSDSHSMGYVAL